MTIAFYGPGIFTTVVHTKVDFLQPETSDCPSLAELIYPLANQCRWGGQTWDPYPVAAHCVYVSHLVETLSPPRTGVGEFRELQIAGLLHDLHEGISQDIITPVKLALGDNYKKFERRWHARLMRELGFDDRLGAYRELVDQADTMALSAEDADLRGGRVLADNNVSRPQGAPPVTPMTALQAREAFRQRWAELLPTRAHEVQPQKEWWPR